MRKIGFLAFIVAVVASSQALADTSYMFCFGGGRAGLYYSAVFPVPHGTNDEGKAQSFNAFVKSKYGVMIFSECHSDGTQAGSASSKKIRIDSDQQSHYPSKLIETGWAGK
jgi:hypothetical protein